MVISRTLRLGGLAACFCIIGPLPLANANCYSRCHRVCGYLDSVCKSENDRCYYNCTLKKPGSGDYGAIAYSPTTGATGWSRNHDYREEAESNALEECRKNAADCEVELWFDHSCGAIATSDKGVSWGVGDRGVEARFSALEKCRQGGGENCEVKEVVRSRGNE